MRLCNFRSRAAVIYAGGQPFTIRQSGVGGNCETRPIQAGQTIAGTIDEADCLLPTTNVFGDRIYVDSYSFNGRAGEKALITLTGTVILTLITPSGVSIADLAGRLTTLPEDGVYQVRILVNSNTNRLGADYQFRLLLSAATCSYETASGRDRKRRRRGEFYRRTEHRKLSLCNDQYCRTRGSHRAGRPHRHLLGKADQGGRNGIGPSGSQLLPVTRVARSRLSRSFLFVQRQTGRSNRCSQSKYSRLDLPFTARFSRTTDCANLRWQIAVQRLPLVARNRRLCHRSRCIQFDHLHSAACIA